MTTQDRDDRTATLRTWLSSLSGLALARIADAPLGKWTLDQYVDRDGCRCLVGHAEDWAQRPGLVCSTPRAQVADRLTLAKAAEAAFHAFCRWDGLKRTVAAVQAYAATLVATRAAAAVAALCGEHANADA